MANPIIHSPVASAAEMDQIIRSLTPFEIEITPQNGGTYLIPNTSSLIINVLLWPGAPLDDLQLILPAGMVAGRRVFIYTDKSITQLAVTSAEPGATVVNGMISMSANDLTVFNTVSTTNKLWARVASS